MWASLTYKDKYKSEQKCCNLARSHALLKATFILLNKPGNILCTNYRQVSSSAITFLTLMKLDGILGGEYYWNDN